MLKYLLILLIPTLSLSSECLSRKGQYHAVVPRAVADCYAPVMPHRHLASISYVELHSAINVAIAKNDAQYVADLIKNRSVEEGALDKGMEVLYKKLEDYHEDRELEGYTRDYHGYVFYQAIAFLKKHKLLRQGFEVQEQRQ